MADLAKTCMDHWDELEKDAGLSLRWMSGLLNFGDPTIGQSTPEGNHATKSGRVLANPYLRHPPWSEGQFG